MPTTSSSSVATKMFPRSGAETIIRSARHLLLAVGPELGLLGEEHGQQVGHLRDVFGRRLFDADHSRPSKRQHLPVLVHAAVDRRAVDLPQAVEAEILDAEAGHDGAVGHAPA